MPEISESKLLDYINVCIHKNYMMWILITSGAQGKLPNPTFGYGAGKSTRGLELLNKAVYAENWEKTKANTIGAYWDIPQILNRPNPTLGVYWDDMQTTVGKDKQHNEEIRELAYYLTTVRPYCHVWIGSCPHRDLLQIDFRGLIDFEIICSVRGVYEVQQLKRRVDFEHPLNIKERMHYRGEGIFLSLPAEIQSWYDTWRDEKNREIRARLGAFKGVEDHKELDRNSLTSQEHKLLEDITKAGFIRYETLHDKDLGLTASRLKRRGWLEIDGNRRYALTWQAEEIMLAPRKVEPMLQVQSSEVG
jgi:hypothetical protein